ncbi:unnamed protein product [Macrosiphum euphorbiae]|uniref:Uncharacterized protein n=1 Tax=Macrosiphum euphorbiae TaxID=13131 RepID=A0AAV0WLT8_9HEMI|nr:unnamed protein product [Macrosiphum euphorbiae]
MGQGTTYRRLQSSSVDKTGESPAATEAYWSPTNNGMSRTYACKASFQSSVVGRKTNATNNITISAMPCNLGKWRASGTVESKKDSRVCYFINLTFTDKACEQKRARRR